MTQRQKTQQYFVIGFNLFTVILWGSFVYAFFSRQSVIVPWSLVDLYLITLSFYAADKEIRRWRHLHRSTKLRGEYITFGWIGTIVFMLGIEVAGGGAYHYSVPQHMGLAVGGILIIYFVTQYLKAEYGQRRKRPTTAPAKQYRRKKK